MNKRIKSNYINDSMYMLAVASQLKHFSEQRNFYRREARKLLKEYCNYVDDKVVSRKLKQGYFKDLIDKKIIDTLLKTRLKDGVLNG